MALSVPSITGSAWSTTLFLLLTNLSTALNDVVIDARVVEMSRLDPENGANNLQTVSWSMMALGGVIGSLLAGLATDHLGARSVFLFASIGPIIVIGLSMVMRESRVNTNTSDSSAAAQCFARSRKQSKALLLSVQKA